MQSALRRPVVVVSMYSMRKNPQLGPVFEVDYLLTECVLSQVIHFCVDTVAIRATVYMTIADRIHIQCLCCLAKTCETGTDGPDSDHLLQPL